MALSASDRFANGTAEDCRRAVWTFFWFALLAWPVYAGPPFHTDDPEPVAFHHWEAYLFATTDRAKDGHTYQAPAWELNTGAAPNLQLHLVIPLGYFRAPGERGAYGLGDVETGIKYRFVNETSIRPQIGIFPMLEVPSGSVSRGLGNGKAWTRLPVWIQKNIDGWTTYGGAGWIINTASGMRSHPFGGWLLQRAINKRITLGGEVYAEGTQGLNLPAFAILTLGGYYNVNEHFSILFNAGRQAAGGPHTIGCFGLYWTWGPDK
jgi:hypothetical protein